MLGIEEAVHYMVKMREASKLQLNNPDSIYYGEEGHLRLARECGYALRDFDKAGQAHILHGSYSVIYVSGCLLRPILDAREWMNETRKGSRLFTK